MIAGDAIGDAAADGDVHEPLWRQLGVDSCGATLIDLQTLEPLASRWVRDGGSTTGVAQGSELEATFKGRRPGGWRCRRA